MLVTVGVGFQQGLLGSTVGRGALVFHAFGALDDGFSAFIGGNATFDSSHVIKELASLAC